MKFLSGCLKGLLLAFLLAVGTAGVGSEAWAEAGPGVNADTVVVQGATRGDADAIRGYFAGLDQASVNRGIEDLNATGMFSKVIP